MRRFCISKEATLVGSSLIVNSNLFQIHFLIALAGIQIACFHMHIAAEDLGASSVSDPGGRSVQPSSNASNSLQTLYKTEHSGASGASWLRRPDLPDPFQMLQILYKSLTKRSILEPRAPPWLRNQIAGWLAGWLAGCLAGCWLGPSASSAWAAE